MLNVLETLRNLDGGCKIHFNNLNSITPRYVGLVVNKVNRSVNLVFRDNYLDGYTLHASGPIVVFGEKIEYEEILLIDLWKLNNVLKFLEGLKDIQITKAKWDILTEALAIPSEGDTTQ